jgi:sugar-specific transcriptional regulator TrmB
LKSSKESKYKIDSFEQKLFKSEDALDPKISTFFSDISNFHKKLMQGDGTESAIKQQIQDVQKSISEEITDIRNKITVAKEEIDGLHEFYEKFLEHLAKKMKTF